jgi:hypothetical protein
MVAAFLQLMASLPFQSTPCLFCRVMCLAACAVCHRGIEALGCSEVLSVIKALLCLCMPFRPFGFQGFCQMLYHKLCVLALPSL